MTDPLLDLSEGVGQVSISYSYEVLDKDNVVVGEVNPEESPSVDNRTSAAIMRTMNNFNLREDEAADINPLVNRIRPKFILEDGRKWSMGVFLFVEDETTDSTYEERFQSVLWDQNYVLDQEMARAFSMRKGSYIVPGIISLAEQAGITLFNNATTELSDTEDGHSTRAVVGDDIIYPPGTRRLEAIRRLAEMAGLLPPYFDRDGVFQLRPIPKLEETINTLRYSKTDKRVKRIIVGSGKRRSNLLKAPNVFVVANSGSTEGDILGIAYIDPALPHSRENRGGFELVEYERVQGIESSAAARRMARDRASVFPGDYEEVRFEGPPDPRHDTFDVVMYNEKPFREVEWSLQLTPGAPHRHLLNRAGVNADD